MIRLSSSSSLLVLASLASLLSLSLAQEDQTSFIAPPSSGFGDLNGFLDTATFQSVSGWACSPSQPFRPINVQIFVDGRLVTVVTANQRREQAVGQQCGGNSNHGFTFTFSPSQQRLLSDGRRHTVRAVAQVFIPRFLRRELNNSPRFVMVSNNPPIGFLDTASRTTVTGWTCDANNFNVPLRVDIYIDNQFIGSTTANRAREPAVGQQCGGNSNHGFVFNFPFGVQQRFFNGQARSVSAFAIDIPNGNNFPLTGSPKTVF